MRKKEGLSALRLQNLPFLCVVILFLCVVRLLLMRLARFFFVCALLIFWYASFFFFLYLSWLSWYMLRSSFIFLVHLFIYFVHLYICFDHFAPFFPVFLPFCRFWGVFAFRTFLSQEANRRRKGAFGGKKTVKNKNILQKYPLEKLDPEFFKRQFAPKSCWKQEKVVGVTWSWDAGLFVFTLGTGRNRVFHGDFFLDVSFFNVEMKCDLAWYSGKRRSWCTLFWRNPFAVAPKYGWVETFWFLFVLSEFVGKKNVGWGWGKNRSHTVWNNKVSFCCFPRYFMEERRGWLSAPEMELNFYSFFWKNFFKYNVLKIRIICSI